MDDSTDKKATPRASSGPDREIGNAHLFADDIVFSDTEKILFEEDLERAPTHQHAGLMDGDPQDRYAATKKLNEGGMKAIWEVDDHRTARKVAMALIQESRVASEADIDAFLYEARLTANLQHPNIIPIYDIAIDEDGNPYFTMKALKGETLSEIIKRLRDGSEDYLRRFTRTRLLAVFLKVCNAIDYAHTKGVIHLDLKPSNVNVGDFGDVHVLDWGLSTLITHLNEYDGEPVSWHSMDDVELEDGQTLTRYLESSAKRRERNNVVGGTPGYMSPEQAHGVPADIDFQTDVYMLGSLLYEILTFHCPIEGGTVKEALQRTVRGEVVPPTKRAPERKIPPALAAIAMKAMSTDPADRYPNVATLISDVHKYQDGFATVAENPTFVRHLTLLVNRHKLAVGLIAASVAVIGGVLAQSFSSIKRSEQVALDALERLQEKNEYIAATARTVAPDYLDLMREKENDFQFAAAAQALDTSLAFDPELADAWAWKGKVLLSQLDFAGAWAILSGEAGNPIQESSPVARLAKKYLEHGEVADADLPQLVRDFQAYGVAEMIPRLFAHLNRAPFDPNTRFPAIQAALGALNPNAGEIHLAWQRSGAEGWIIDIGNNPELNNIAALCGLKILMLNASRIGEPDLGLLTEPGMIELRLGDTPLNHLFDLDQMRDLQSLDISGTNIRNISNIIRYPKLRSLDISGIAGLEISPRLVWNRNLKILTVSSAFKDDATIRTLTRRGVIIIYSDD